MDQNTTGLGRGAEDGGPSDRPLGRGLEDISPLFRSEGSSSEAANERAAGRLPQRTTSPRGSPPDAVLLGPTRRLTRDQLALLLKEFTGALEEGLRSIDSEIGCPPCGEIDLLALSRTHRLTIIDIDTNAGEGLLMRGIGHVDWVTRNLSIIRRLYAGHTIDYCLPPALVLVAPQFPPLLRSVTRQVTRPTIKCVRYQALESPAGLGIFFERLEGD